MADIQELTDEYVLSKGTDREKITLLKDKFEKADNYRQDYEVKWETAERIFRRFIDKNNYMFKSKIFVPKTSEAILTIIQNIIPLLFENKKFFELVNVEEADEETFELIENLILNELYLTNNFI